jgi:hypothetical protein
VPDGIELFADDDVEGLEVGVFDVQVVKVELLKGEYGEPRFTFRRTVVFERLSSESVEVMHWMIAW